MPAKFKARCLVCELRIRPPTTSFLLFPRVNHPLFDGCSFLIPLTEKLWFCLSQDYFMPLRFLASVLDFCGFRLFGMLLLFSQSVMSDPLWPHGLQHARPPCPSPTPRACLTHVHWVSDAVLPSHPLSAPSLPAFNLYQHQGLFQGVSSSHQVAKVLKLQQESFQWIFRTDFPNSHV